MGSTSDWLAVVGASAGGVESLRRFTAHLPADLGAAVAVVLHVSPNAPSSLPQILARSGRLDAVHAHDGAPVKAGLIVVAPPGRHHLIVADATYTLVTGPTENGVRPAVDVLFRSAANVYGPRCIGVVLSGTRDDGTAGLEAIRAAGGTTMVQDPSDAAYPDMPNSAITRLEQPDVVATADDLARRLAELVTVHDEEEDDVADRVVQEIASREMPRQFSCPDCGGPMREDPAVGVARFRCHVGHRWAEAALEDAQSRALDRAMWTALRMIDERIALTGEMRARARARSQTKVVEMLDERLAELGTQADTLRDLVDAGPLNVPELGRVASS